MSPEQARGQDLDARTDLFSFGVVLYEMATGQKPFPGNTAAAIFEGILTKPPAPANLSGGLGPIISKALEKNCDLRTQTAAELRGDLKRLQRGVSEPVRVARKRARIFFWMAAMAGVAGVYFVSRPTVADSWKDASFTQLTQQPGQELYPSLSPDGKSFVYASRAAGNLDIYLQRVGGRNANNLTKDSPDDDTQPAFSPDGERIAFRSERQGGGIFVMGATGESVRRVTNFGYNPTWSPDSKKIVYSTAFFPDANSGRTMHSQLFVVDAQESIESSGPRLITERIEDAVQPSWSPNGRRIAFWSLRDGNRDIWTLPVNGGDPIQVTREPATDWNPVWSPDGKYLYFSSDRGGSMNLWRVRIEETSGKILGPAEAVTTPSSDASYIAFARDGQRLAYVNATDVGNIYKIDYDPVHDNVVGQPSPITQGSWDALCPDVSPDNQWIAFTTWRKPEDLYVIRSDGTGLRQLTDDEHRDRVANWSPDGQRIAFYSNRGDRYQIWSINPDGGGLQQLTHERLGNAVYPAWSRDGSRLSYVVADRNLSAASFILRLSDGLIETLPPLGEQGAWFEAFSWSPDGRRLAGQRSSVAGPGGIYVYSVEGHRYERFTDFGFTPRWLSDSQRLVFGGAAQGSSEIYTLDTRSGKVHSLLSIQPREISGVALSRDDRTLYFGAKSSEADVWLMSRK
jgi:Tol biopolymer transport system component